MTTCKRYSSDRVFTILKVHRFMKCTSFTIIISSINETLNYFITLFYVATWCWPRAKYDVFFSNKPTINYSLVGMNTYQYSLLNYFTYFTRYSLYFNHNTLVKIYLTRIALDTAVRLYLRRYPDGKTRCSRCTRGGRLYQRESISNALCFRYYFLLADNDVRLRWLNH